MMLLFIVYSRIMINSRLAQLVTNNQRLWETPMPVDSIALAASSERGATVSFTKQSVALMTK